MYVDEKFYLSPPKQGVWDAIGAGIMAALRWRWTWRLFPFWGIYVIWIVERFREYLHAAWGSCYWTLF